MKKKSFEIAAYHRSFDVLCRMLYRFRFNFCSFSGTSKNSEKTGGERGWVGRHYVGTASCTPADFLTTFLSSRAVMFFLRMVVLTSLLYSSSSLSFLYLFLFFFLIPLLHVYIFFHYSIYRHKIFF